MWLFKITFHSTTTDNVARDLHKFRIDLRTPQKRLSQLRLKRSQTQAIRQAMPVKRALGASKRLKCCVYSLCTGILGGAFKVIACVFQQVF